MYRKTRGKSQELLFFVVVFFKIYRVNSFTLNFDFYPVICERYDALSGFLVKEYVQVLVYRLED